MAASGEISAGDVLSFGPFRLVAAQRLLLRDDAPVAIGGRAFDILTALTERAGNVVSKRELTDLVWQDVTVGETNLRVNIAALRRTLGEGKNGGRYIVNVRGRGYSFVAAIRRSVTDDALSTAADRSAPKCSVVGLGGVGETTVAHALRPDFGNDSVYVVDLGSLSDPTHVPSVIASALGCLVHGPEPEPRMRAFLAARRTLIVLDNCAHVKVGSPARETFPSCGAGGTSADDWGGTK